jgi:hypothetical protein
MRRIPRPESNRRSKRPALAAPEQAKKLAARTRNQSIA